MKRRYHRLIALSVFALATTATLVSSTAAALLTSFGGETPDIKFDDLLSGYLLPLYFGPTLWRSFPTVWFPSWGFYFEFRALTVTGVLGAGILYLVRRVWRQTWTLAAVLFLLLSFAMFVGGSVTASGAERDPSEVGQSLAFSIYGSGYCQAVAAVLALVGAWRDGRINPTS